MTTLKLLKYTDEDSRLIDADDAIFIRRKVDADTVLDFSGVVEVSAPFLDALLDGETPETIGDRITGQDGAVDDALADWVDRCGEAVAVIERPATKKRVPVTKPAPKPVQIERQPVSDDRYTPTRLIQRLGDALRGYIESAYPLSDPTLIRARRHLLEDDAGGHLLSQEPFIETTTRYATSDRGYDGIGLPAHIGGLFARLATTHTASSTSHEPRTILYPGMYRHQEEAFRTALVDGQDMVVATGTGSGKTECFLVPILGSLYDEAHQRPESFAGPAVRTLLLYPMNALVNDQLSRLRLLFGEAAVADEFASLEANRFPRFGMYTGRTQYPGRRKAGKDGGRVAPLLEYYLNMDPALEDRLRRVGRYPAKDLKAFYAKDQAQTATYQSGKKAGQEYTKHHWERRLHTGDIDRELITRHEMIHGAGTTPGHSPDILVTNYSMLEYMLMRPFERPIFAETRSWLQRDDAQLTLVLDEAHMYRGAQGAEVAFLLRRLLARLGIQDRPDKLRVIATSASLGSDKEALRNIRSFAADLTGKTPGDFKAITGNREVPTPASPGSPEEATVLASLDLEAINNAHTGAALATSLEPALRFYGTATKSGSPAEVLAALHDALAGNATVNQLIHEAADTAQRLDVLAGRVFPGHSDARSALEALLAIGTLARPTPDSPGLVPTRVHGMFRGLHGIYACLNDTCSGRQPDPGEPAAVGKLHTSPEASCGDCGSRVFELASCRSCGAPYIHAYAERGRLDNLEFLWGETEGNLIRFQAMPGSPRYSDRVEEVRVHVRTGYVDLALQYPDEEVRSLYLPLDGGGARQTDFDRCVMCQPDPRSRARIFDFRTRGEQPFTALVETQFAEQAPQNADPKLPNHGRKVLVFSDGRQKAARLAPALEHSHARDLFRQVIALASEQLRRTMELTSMQMLYPGVVWLCANEGYNLFPSTDEVEFHNHLRRVKGKSLEDSIRLANRGVLKPTRSFARALFEELTDRYYSLTALALGTIEEDPDEDQIFVGFPEVGLDHDAIRVLFRSWVRLHLERRSFRPDGAELRDLGEGWQGPVGINAQKMGDVLPSNFSDYLGRILDNSDHVTLVAEWFQRLVRSSLLHFEGDQYYLQPPGLSIGLRLEAGWLRCVDCGRIHPEVLKEFCPGCCGQVVQADPAYLDARTGFYRDQVLRAFDPRSLEPFGLTAEEHSAQLTGNSEEGAFNKVEEHELRFQDIPLDGQGPVDILSCTTTMEVGIDIGALSGVALRNVPPHVANYQQRAGRAGRRGRSIASVVTYAHGSSHDSHFFAHPAAIISGDVRPPVVYIENQQVLGRHISAYLLQRFFHETVPADTGTKAYQLFESLGTVEEFLSEQHLCSLNRLSDWLTANEPGLQEELRSWVPTFSHGLGEAVVDVANTVADAVGRLQADLRRVLPVEEFAKRDELEGLEREGLERRLEEDLLQTLIGRAVFPRYAFPTDVVTFWVSKERRPGETSGRREYDYEPQRDLQLALSEYAPGRSLTIDKWRFESAAIFSPYEPLPGPTLDRRQPYTFCKECGYVSLDNEAATLIHCPVCGSDELARAQFITPAGFAPDMSEKREVDRGQPIAYAGMTERAQLEIQDPPESWDRELFEGRVRIWTGPRRLAVVNKGVGGRGFRVCPDCGRSEPEYGPGFTKTKLMRGGSPVQHKNPMERNAICVGAADGPFFMGHRFPTDVLLVRIKVAAPVQLGTPTTPGLLSRASRMALTSLVESVALAATRELQIDEGELSGWWAPVLGGRTDEAQLYLYDLLPGGAGYARAVGEALETVFDTAEALLADCDCATSCYRCIRHYGNNYIHASLDRHLALALLRHARSGAVPGVDENEKQRNLVGLRDYLALRGLEAEQELVRDGIKVPLVFTPSGGTVWVDVHHPLVDPALNPSAVARAAELAFQEVVEMDAYELAHDLPEAVRRLNLPAGPVV